VESSLRIITKRLPSNHNLFLFGDDHEGTTLRHRKGWQKLINMMHSEYEGCKANYGWHHGDPIEAIMVDDRRYHPDTVSGEGGIPLPLNQMEQAIKNIEPIAHMVLGMNESNHPLKLWRFGNITKEICERLKIPYATWSAKAVIRTTHGQLMYKSFHTHGRKSITSTADDPKRRTVNQRLILKRHL